jgi:hypothetical protein
MYVFTGLLDAEISYATTGQLLMGFFDIFYFEMDLTVPVALPDGWISIYKTNVNDQPFAWVLSLTGDSYSFYTLEGLGNSFDVDFAFELTTSDYEPDVYIDIKPGSCPNPLNTKSKGVLPVAICGTDTFDVMDIDPETVQLIGVSPLRWKLEDVATPFTGDLCDCHDLNGDGYMDLTLKFKTQEIVSAFCGYNDGDYITLTLTGNLMTGEPFEGQDCVWIIDK